MKEKPKKSIDCPLLDKKILITRPKEQIAGMADQLRRYGAKPLLFPTIKIVSMESYRELDRSIERLPSYDWLIFTSVNGFKYFLIRLKEKGKGIKELTGIKVAAIGTKTAQTLRERGINVDIVPGEYRAEGLIEGMKKEGVGGKRILIPRAESAREILPRELRKWGAKVDVVAVYKTVKPSSRAYYLKKLLKEGEIDVITFTSPSTVQNFVEMLGIEELRELIKRSVVASIGPITQKAARSRGIKTDIMPEEYTIEALIEAIKEYFMKNDR